jgi:hypothetical protein
VQASRKNSLRALVKADDDMPIRNLTGLVTRDGRFPEAHGGFADVWKGTWRDGDRLVPVRVSEIAEAACLISTFM